jgi:hypothetical protein
MVSPVTAEYSYFRAEGLSLSAIEMVEEAKREFEALKRKLCAQFKADEMLGWMERDSNRFKVMCFIFHPPTEPPEGWKDTQERQMSYDKSRVQTIFSRPGEGSPDQFHVASVTGLMERAVRFLRLEDAFGCGDMPVRELPAGDYSGQFVRTATWKDPANPVSEGKLRDQSTMIFGSNSAVRGSDPLDYMQLNDAWYIRVPNARDTGLPAFAPPDAKAVDFDDMLLTDMMEYHNRFSRPRHYPSIH